MYTTKKISCLVCGKKFLPKSEKNYYCCRRCFKKAYYHKKKGEELNLKEYPFFICPKCLKQIKLDFDPATESTRWLHYSCPNCSTLMINVSETISIGDVSIS